MSISTKFETFNNNIRISQDNQNKISSRYKQITKRLNLDFYGSDSETNHSLYVGSYGRDTDIHVSDVDMLFQLSYKVYEQYNKYSGNNQSALLQAVKVSLKKTYSTPHIKGDGQVMGINFNDGICFEIVPCFINNDNSFTYPDTNNDGNWRTTNPKPEIKEIGDKNQEWNKNLKRLCRMARVWKDNWDVPIGGLLIDTLAYNFLKNWEHKNESYTYYDWMIRDFLEYVKNQNETQNYWYAVGSNTHIYNNSDFRYKAKRCYNISLEAIKCEEENKEYSANQKWKEIFGSKFIG